MPPNADLLAEIEPYERAVWQALVSGDGAADRALLDASFLGVYPDGFAGRADHAGQLGDGPTIAAFTLDDLRCRALGPDHALLCYRATFRRPAAGCGEEAGTAEEPAIMYVSSIWQRSGPGWINIFSQDTPAARAEGASAEGA